MKNNDLNLIERYFDKALSKSELGEFETRMETDPEFAEAFACRQDLQDAFVLGGELEELKKVLVAVEAKLDDEEIPVSSEVQDAWMEPVKIDELKFKNNARLVRLYKRAMVAASVLLLFCTSCAVSLRNSQMVLESETRMLKGEVDRQQRLIAELKGENVVYEEKIDGMSLLKGGELAKLGQGMALEEQLENANVMIEKLIYVALNSVSENFLYRSKGFKFSDFISRGSGNADSLLVSGQEKYKKQDYEGAIVDFEELLNIDSKDNEVLFYKGLCYTMVSRDRWRDAIAIFEELLNERAYGREEDNLLWHLALLYIKTGQFENAKEKLRKVETMKDPEHGKKVEAEKLLSYFT